MCWPIIPRLSSALLSQYISRWNKKSENEKMDGSEPSVPRPSPPWRPHPPPQPLAGLRSKPGEHQHKSLSWRQGALCTQFRYPRLGDQNSRDGVTPALSLRLLVVPGWCRVPTQRRLSPVARVLLPLLPWGPIFLFDRAEPLWPVQWGSRRPTRWCKPKSLHGRL